MEDNTLQKQENIEELRKMLDTVANQDKEEIAKGKEELVDVRKYNSVSFVKEENGEKFSLSKNIVYAGKEKKGVTVSTLEEVETKDYTIFFENTKNIVKDENGIYKKNQDNLGLWVYDNALLQDERNRYFGTFADTTCYGQFDYHERLSHIEKSIKKDYLLPDYVTKIETELNEHEKMVGTIHNNYLENLEYHNEDIFYFDHLKCKRAIYSDMEKYVREMKMILSLETSFDGGEKRIDDYKVSEKEKVKSKKTGD